MTEDTDRTTLLSLELLLRLGNRSDNGFSEHLHEEESWQPQAGINRLLEYGFIQQCGFSVKHKMYHLTYLGKRTYDLIKEPMIKIYNDEERESKIRF